MTLDTKLHPTKTFFGEFEVTLDSKGRVSVPAAYRKVIAAIDKDKTHIISERTTLDKMPILAIHPSHYLNQSAADRGTLDFLQIDVQGRLQISPLVMNYLGCKNGATLLARAAKDGSHFYYKKA